MKTATEIPNAPAENGKAVRSSAVLGEPHLTLTIEEIRDLAGMCGLVVKDALDKEKEDERETEITITPWPATGIKDENGKPYAHAHKHLAYFEEYPEEGCVPLGSPNNESSHGAGRKEQDAK